MNFKVLDCFLLKTNKQTHKNIDEIKPHCRQNPHERRGR